MSTQANVQSIEALRDFRAALVAFADEALGALGAVDMEIRRTQQWLQHDQRMFWQGEIKRRREQVSMARSELARRKLGKMYGHGTSHSEQKEILDRAEGRMKEAEARAAMVKKWEPLLQQAVLEYHGQSRRVADLIGGDMPRSMALLDRIIASLDAYASLSAPSGALAGDPIGNSGAEASVALAPAESPNEQETPAQVGEGAGDVPGSDLDPNTPHPGPPPQGGREEEDGAFPPPSSPRVGEGRGGGWADQ